jgi:hypothetical protein
MDFASALGHSAANITSWSEEELTALRNRSVWPGRRDFERALSQGSPTANDAFLESKKRIHDTALAVAVVVVRHNVAASAARLSAQWLGNALDGTALLNSDIAKGAAELLGEEWREKVKQSALGPGPELDKPSASDLTSAKELLEEYISDRELEEEEPSVAQPSAPASSSAPSVNPTRPNAVGPEEPSQDNYGTGFLKLEEELKKLREVIAQIERPEARSSNTPQQSYRAELGAHPRRRTESNALQHPSTPSREPEKDAPDWAYEPDIELYVTEHAALLLSMEEVAASTRAEHCVECGLVWLEPSSRAHQTSFVCGHCSEDGPGSIDSSLLEDLWDRT